MKKVLTALLALTLYFTANVCSAQSYELKGHVNDYAKVLSVQERKQLEDILREYENETSNQFVILCVTTLGDETPEDFRERIFKQWRLGHSKTDNGLLLVHATQERKITIEVGYGLEGVIPDGLAGQVIRDQIAPHFKVQHFFEGYRDGMQALMKAAAGEYVATDQTRRVNNNGSSTEEKVDPKSIFIFGCLVVAVIVVGVIGAALGLVAGGVAGAITTVIALSLLTAFSWFIILLFAIAGFIAGVVASIMVREGGSGGGSGSWGGGFSSGGGGGGGGYSGGGGSSGGGGATGSY